MTKYDVSISGKLETKLAKRNAIFLMIKHMCDSGVKPEKIMEIIDWRPISLFLQFDGVLNSEEFIDAAIAKRKTEGRVFKKGRWFCADDEIIHSEGNTWALSKMWGHKTIIAMNKIKETFPEAKIDFSVSKEE